ncbi:hypothetical protein AAG570_005078 [Ranatra chinensis]|uniref:Ribonuclease P protein subunit p20 n=1 Tax=Ranatra chinensis TaxID=642074 RepID=A0ABD0XZH8_9HEMI
MDVRRPVRGHIPRLDWGNPPGFLTAARPTENDLILPLTFGVDSTEFSVFTSALFSDIFVGEITDYIRKNVQGENHTRTETPDTTHTRPDPLQLRDTEYFANDDLSTSLPKQGPSGVSIPGRRRYRSDPGHVVRKRVPPRNSTKCNDVYITNKSDFKAQQSKCIKLIEGGETEIILHGLGAAVTRAINLALQLEEHFNGSYCIDVQTSSLRIVDDLEPTTDALDYDTQTRVNSAIHIRFFQKELPKLPVEPAT